MIKRALKAATGQMIYETYETGNFYSVIPCITEEYCNTDTKFINLNFNDEKHVEILNDLPKYLINFDETFGHKNTVERKNNYQYSLMNGMFEWMDARMLHYFLRKNKPKKIIEIGSGNSTLLTYNTKNMYNLDLQITCIEPYPKDYLTKLHTAGNINLIANKLENVDLEIFKTLEANDILFIDSSHVMKLDSDVMYYMTKIFPVLKKNVLIHIHDVFFPYDYPTEWLKQGRFWNEQYFLFGFLQYNTKFKIQFCNSYAHFKYNAILKDIQRSSYETSNNLYNGVYSGGSLWLLVTE